MRFFTQSSSTRDGPIFSHDQNDSSSPPTVTARGEKTYEAPRLEKKGALDQVTLFTAGVDVDAGLVGGGFGGG